MNTDDPDWNSRVEAPLVLPDGASIDWDDTADVIVVGLGGAGVCAALEAMDGGASVIAIDRFGGGGATRMSGGVYYAGGGTPFQSEAGVEDTTEEMYKYLKLEVDDVVEDRTLRDFCKTSSESVEWLAGHGVRFNSTLSPKKTSYPASGYFLYHSGNETQAAYAARAKPAQRGHRTYGTGLTGHRFFDSLFKSALEKGLKLYSYSEGQRFIVSEDGEILGIKIRQVSKVSPAAGKLSRIARKFARSTTLLFPAIAEKLVQQANAISERDGKARFIQIKKAAILAAGGYIHNRKMVQQYAPEFSGAIPLGSIGCDGSGIRLGQTVGAMVGCMDNISAWRIIQPPAAMATGIIVNGKGERFIAEDCYGGTIGHHIARHHDGAAYIILDATLRRQVLFQALPGRGKLFRLQGAPALMGLFLSSRKAGSLEELARKCGMDPARLTDAVSHYNRSADGLEEAKFPKHPDFTGRIIKPPFYAIDISIGNRRYLCPSISLGGIIVNEATGQALDGEGKPIPKLYAAGKNAKGVSSHRYISGLSLADCVYSGRIAGRCAASSISSQKEKNVSA
ncbi:FAD-binding protein [Emcibacter sp.]|uniref:FAD-binding protein n=1 Tax=Emcibacter sp. TaxID=1979954 RepID=UPI002AA7459F|nr:FAD-binding protein [Emcibacter sp.]